MHPSTLLLLKRKARPPSKLGTIARMNASVLHVPGTQALVLDSPHSGTVYPADFRFSCGSVALRGAEDTHVEKLYDFAPAMGVHWVEATFPRSYLDANRNTTEIDETLIDGAWIGPIEQDAQIMSKVRLGKGLIWRTLDDGTPIYDRKLTVVEVKHRVASCWKPYHDAVAASIDAAHAAHGYSIHINCHSMPAVASANATDFPGEAHADFVVGDRDGTSAHPALSALMCTFIRNLGYSVAYNHPYKGVELVRRYSNPQAKRHSIQLEINRRLYMREDTLELLPHFTPLKSHLRLLVDWLLKIDPNALES